MKSISGSSRGTRILLVAAAFLFILCLLAVGILYLGKGQVLPPTVTIVRPESGLLAEVNQSIPVDVSAYFDRGISRVELYADGALVGSQASELAGGSNPLVMAQPWIPLTTGRHLLMARAYDLNGGHYDSSVLPIDVVSQLSNTASINTDGIELGPGARLPSLQDISQATGASLDTLRGLNPDLANHAAGSPLPPGIDLVIPYTPDQPSDTTPPPSGGSSSPQITQVEATDCTTVQLGWSSVTGATGYTLYRLVEGDSAFTAIASLGAGVTSFTDTLPHFGGYIYQLGAVQGSSETLSAPASVRTADGCEPAAPAGTTNLTVSFLSLTTTQRFDGIYCYSSMAGSPFRRIPQYDFQVMQPEADGLTYNLQTQLAYFGQLVLPSQPTSQPIALTLECWGRLGTESTPLGTIISTQDSSAWDGRDLTETADSVSLLYRINGDPQISRPINIPLSPNLPGPQLDLPAVFMPLDGSGSSPILPPPTNVRDIRGINSTLCNTLANFGVHPPYCQGSNTWRVGDSIAWDWSDPTGLYSADRDLFGYHIKIDQLDMNDPHHPILSTLAEYNTHPGRLMSSDPPGVLNHIGCGTRVLIYVEAVADFGTSDYSEPAIFDGPPCTRDNMITVTIEQVVVGDGSHDSVTDGDPCVLCTDRRLELYGSFLIDNVGGSILDGPTTHNGPEFGACPDQTQCVNGGVYTFGASGGSLFFEGSSSFSAPGTGQSLNMTADLYDYDYFTYLAGFLQGTLSHFSNDPAAYRWCHATLTLPGRSAVDWERFDQTFHLRDHSPEGACDIQVHVQGGVH